jgi:hypothetical protein
MRVPVLTVAVLFTTFGFTCAEHLHPSLLGLLQRDQRILRVPGKAAAVVEQDDIEGSRG